VTYNSEDKDAFIVVDKQGNHYHFTPTGSSLYAYRHKPSKDQIFINTVEQNKIKYSQWAYNDTIQAKQIQDIIICPNSCNYQHITSHHLLPNCPITPSDRMAAENIFGPNLSAIKGTTVTRPGSTTEARIDSIPSEIMKIIQDINLSVDIMYVNKVLFFIMLARHLQICNGQTSGKPM